MRLMNAEMNVTIFVTGRFGGRPRSIGLTETEFDADQPVAFVARVDGAVGEQAPRQHHIALVGFAHFVTFAICKNSKTKVNEIEKNQFTDESQLINRGKIVDDRWVIANY